MADTPTTPRTYPHGVPSWIDLETPDVDAALGFYRDLFGWRFTEMLPPGAPAISTGLPSFNSIVGTMPVVRAFPAAMEFLRPGIGSKSFIELL